MHAIIAATFSSMCSNNVTFIENCYDPHIGLRLKAKLPMGMAPHSHCLKPASTQKE